MNNDEYYPEDFIDPELDEETLSEVDEIDEEVHANNPEVEELLTMKLPELRKYIF